MRILVTGGAGFVGSNIAFGLQERGNRVVVLDNLRRRGSELTLPHLHKRGIEFVHGDIRHPGDLADISGSFDLMIEASAEPSVHAGLQGSPAYVIDTNLSGTVHCLEHARRRIGSLIYLSTSRVYSISALRSIRLLESRQRFEIASQQTLPGISEFGVSEDFSIDGARSLYGATKLASELLLREYVEYLGLKAAIFRCGVIAGPGQFGRTDQGFVSLWVARHYFGQPLCYTGFGGNGLQVRDLLHPADLVDLVARQMESSANWDCMVFNVGGGRSISVSLSELTGLCRETTGRDVAVDHCADTSAVDVPLYITDTRKAAVSLDWRPKRDARKIIGDIADWIQSNAEALRRILGGEEPA